MGSAALSSINSRNTPFQPALRRRLAKSEVFLPGLRLSHRIIAVVLKALILAAPGSLPNVRPIPLPMAAPVLSERNST